MIVAVLIGGPHDGRTVTLDKPTCLVCAMPPGHLFGADIPTEEEFPKKPLTVTYFPDHKSLRKCTCVPDCPHGTVTYYVSGYRR